MKPGDSVTITGFDIKSKYRHRMGKIIDKVANIEIPQAWVVECEGDRLYLFEYEFELSEGEG